jgi:hypothetical protein
MSFTAKIDDLQENEMRLTFELNKWRSQATTELEIRHQVSVGRAVVPIHEEGKND